MTASDRVAHGPATSARQRLAARTKYVFAVPSTGTALGAAVALGAATGVVVSGATVAGVGVGLAVLALPAGLAAALTGPLDRRRDGTFTADRSAFLALAASVVVAAFALAASGVRASAGGGWSVLVDAVLLAAAGTFAFRLLVLVAVSGPPLVDRVGPAAVQPVATVAVVAVAATGTRLAPVTASDLGVAALAAVLYGGVVVGLLAMVDYPLGRQWGISGFEFLHCFVEYAAGRASGLESLLASLGTRAEVPVSVLAIRADGAEKARVVVPLAHPGPLAGVGGGRLPYRLADASEGLAFAPHGLAGHAHDPATRRDVDALCDAAAAAVEDVTYERTATPPVCARASDATVRGQLLGDGPFLVSTFAPAPTDDVSRAVGAEARAAAAGRGEPLVTDAHNARRTDDVDDGLTTPGSARADALVEAVGRASSTLDRAARGPLRVGVAATETPYGVEDGVGPLGVRVLATEVCDQTAAYVLVDGNNMVAGLRADVRRAVDEAVPEIDLVSVSTTDTHAVNRLRSANYVGQSLDASAFAALVADVASDAVEDLEPARAGTASETATITVLGADAIDDIAAFTDRVLPRCGAFVLASSLLVTLTAVALFWTTH